MCSRSRPSLFELVGLLGLISLFASGCGALSSGDHVTTETATVTVTTTGSHQPTTPTSPTTTLAGPNEPTELSGLDLIDPAAFKTADGDWEFATSSGSAVCKFVVGDSGFCHVTDNAGPAWNPSYLCQAHRSDDPTGARSTLAGWESDYRAQPCHTLLDGDWPQGAPVLPPGKKVVFQVDTDHGVTISCGAAAQTADLTCANNVDHGFTVSKSGVKFW